MRHAARHPPDRLSSIFRLCSGAGLRARAAAQRVIAKARGATAVNGHVSLVDAKAASKMLGVPPTWLLALARRLRIGTVMAEALEHLV